ncbi:MAG: acyl-CoA thioesterase [Leptospirales bacterium]|nr:acyl-CoA thioesterase [Leptospirales bacterium]
MSEQQIVPRSTFRVSFHDCDPFGHLNNARYISHFIDARTDHLRDFYGYDAYEDAKKTGKNWVVQGTTVRYLYPARLNEVVEVETRLLRAEKHRLYPEAIMRDPRSGRIHAVVWIDLAYVDLKTGRPVRHGPEISEFVERIIDIDQEIERFDFAKRVAQIISSHARREEIVESEVA